MGDDLSLEERSAVRTPMQWSDAPQAGFSSSKETVYPVISSGDYSYKKINVAAQRRDPNSILNWTAKMIRLRKECPEIGWGNWTIVDTGSPYVLALLYEWRGNAIIILHNFDNKAHNVQMKPDIEGGNKLYNLIDQEEREADKEGVHQMKLEAFGYRWYRVGSLSYVFHY